MTQTASSTAPWTALAAALLLAAVGLTGCIGAMGQSSTGQEHEGTAEEKALAWDQDAELVEVFGAETSGEWGWSNDSYSFNGSHGDVGDGQAPAWVYTYETDEDALNVIVAANGSVKHAEEAEHENQTPVTNWNIDSTEASNIAAENNESWANANPQHAWYVLAQDEPEDDPVWVLGAFQQDRAPVVAVVNATTGEFLGAWDMTFDWDGDWSGDHSWSGSGNWSGDWNDEPPMESGSFEGTLTAVEPEQEHTFEIDHTGHDDLELELDVDQPVASSVTANVTGPAGAQTTLEVEPVGSDDHDTISEPRPGTYTVTVALDQGPLMLEDGVAEDYEFTWCAPGQSYGPNFDEPAC